MGHYSVVRTSGAEQALRQYALSRGVGIDSVDAETLTRTMVAWYAAERADDVDLRANGDMLLFQWGTYSWRSAEPQFEFDLTRQFIIADLLDDDAFFQLSWTALFRSSEATATVGQGDRWCHHPDEVEDFLGFILRSAAGAFAISHRPDRVEVHFGGAG